MLLGIRKDQVRKIMGSRKGCWRLSIAPQIHRALGVTYWKNRELISLAERYDELCQAL